MTDYKVKVHGALAGGRAYSWAWFITSSQTPSALETTMAAALTDYWSNGTYGVNTLYNSSTTLDTFDVITLDGTFRETAKQSHSLSLAGTSSDAPLADDSTLVVQKRSTGLRRNQRGYTHFPALVEGTLASGLYQTTPRNRYGTAVTALLAAIAADGSTMFVHTGAHETVGGVPSYTKTVISSVHASSKPGSQRARTRKLIGTYS